MAHYECKYCGSQMCDYDCPETRAAMEADLRARQRQPTAPEAAAMAEILAAEAEAATAPPSTIPETVATDLERLVRRARAMGGQAAAPDAETVHLRSTPETRARAAVACGDARGAVRELAGLPPDRLRRLRRETWDLFNAIAAAELGLGEPLNVTAGRAGAVLGLDERSP